MTDLTPDEREALLRWSMYGQPGDPVHERFVPTSEQLERYNTFLAPDSSTAWPDVFDREQTEVLLRGFHAREMEDKWNVYADDPAADGTTSVHFLRSWTGNETVRVDLQLTDSGSRITRATWETSPERLNGGSEDFARSTFLEVCRWVLRMRPADSA